MVVTVLLDSVDNSVSSPQPESHLAAIRVQPTLKLSMVQEEYLTPWCFGVFKNFPLL